MTRHENPGHFSFMHPGAQRKHVIKPINRLADGCPARVEERLFPYAIQNGHR